MPLLEAGAAAFPASLPTTGWRACKGNATDKSCSYLLHNFCTRVPAAAVAEVTADENSIDLWTLPVRWVSGTRWGREWGDNYYFMCGDRHSSVDLPTHTDSGTSFNLEMHLENLVV